MIARQRGKDVVACRGVDRVRLAGHRLGAPSPLRQYGLPPPRRPPQLHGPYSQWTRKVDGKTQTRLLNAAQMAHYATWFVNARRLRTLTSELEALSLEIAESAEGWG